LVTLSRSFEKTNAVWLAQCDGFRPFETYNAELHRNSRNDLGVQKVIVLDVPEFDEVLIVNGEIVYRTWADYRGLFMFRTFNFNSPGVYYVDPVRNVAEIVVSQTTHAVDPHAYCGADDAAIEITVEGQGVFYDYVNVVGIVADQLSAVDVLLKSIYPPCSDGEYGLYETVPAGETSRSQIDASLRNSFLPQTKMETILKIDPWWWWFFGEKAASFYPFIGTKKLVRVLNLPPSAAAIETQGTPMVDAVIRVKIDEHPIMRWHFDHNLKQELSRNTHVWHNQSTAENHRKSLRMAAKAGVSASDFDGNRNPFVLDFIFFVVEIGNLTIQWFDGAGLVKC
jgi:hypothetical protein